MNRIGISVVLRKLPRVFDEVFEKTLENHRVKRAKMLESYGVESEGTFPSAARPPAA